MVPAADDARWSRVLQSSTDLANVSLATRLLVSRLRREADENPASVASATIELREFFVKNPFAQPDISKL
ncbi:hypothetical protein ACQ5SO_08300 [Rhodovulum sp. DZ06]|uniref:hypothetical protein n=1 Tax=Rhodovulum sp. DZ06 TaxID=3425126 RepID=UPI003D343FB5